MDTVYPEPLSRVLRRTERRPRDRGKGSAARYRTQPVTFSEIQEVDEENLDDESSETNNNAGAVLISKSEHDLKTTFDNLCLSCPVDQRPPRKRTLKSLNRLSMEGKSAPAPVSSHALGDIPASPESPPSPPMQTRSLSEPRPSI